MRVAAKAFHLEVAIPSVDCIAQRRRWLRRPLKAEHALIRCLDGEPVGFLARFRRPLCRRPEADTVPAGRHVSKVPKADLPPQTLHGGTNIQPHNGRLYAAGGAVRAATR